MAPLLRAAMLWLVLATTAWHVGPTLLAARSEAPAPATAGEVVTALAGLALAACLAWGLWVASALLVEALAALTTRGRPAASCRAPGVPAWVRRTVLGTCAAAVLGAGTVPGAIAAEPGSAAASPAAHGADGFGADGHARPDPRLLPLPDRADGQVRAGRDRPPITDPRPEPESESWAPPGRRTAPSTGDAGVRASRPRPATATVVVHRGDCLWSIAERRLPAAARDLDVARLVARLHDDNRSVIGADADLILPGQRLQMPQERTP